MSAANSEPKTLIAFQGTYGAYSHLACREVLPALEPYPCATFEDAFQALSEGKAGRAMIPVENSLAGRVADIHHLLPESDLYIIGEHFQRVNHQLMAPKGGTLAGLREVHSHIQALSQCRKTLRSLGVRPVVHADTAGACQMVAERGDPAQGAIGSTLAAETYGLDILKPNTQDRDNNITRFLVMARERITPHPKDGPCMTSFVFGVRSVPAALYKALGGFATNAVNITKLESYFVDDSFSQAQFYADIEGHQDDPAVQRAFEELKFFCTVFRLFGTYPRHPFRDRT
ncbi:MAG: prephenate dehydratase [Alphaproteobacteria bacterium]|nr:prephenate dehydratase [Alphaproteobacteria bacterium]